MSSDEFKKRRSTEKERSGNSGITLVALVVTIIILIILAGISISMISGNNGILEKVGNAKTLNSFAAAQEAVDLAFMESIATNGTYDNKTFVNNVENSGYKVFPNFNYVTDISIDNTPIVLEPEESVEFEIIYEITSSTKLYIEIDNEQYEMNVSENGAKISDEKQDGNNDLEVWVNNENVTVEVNGRKVKLQANENATGDSKITINYGSKTKEYDLKIMSTSAKKSESYIGYYADTDKDGTPDGIIFADLAVKMDKTIVGEDDVSFSYDEEDKTSLKKYSISENKYTGFGNYQKEMLTEVDGGGTKDRFYVMSLENIMINRYTNFILWNGLYYTDNEDILSSEDYFPVETGDFSSGKSNTIKMVNLWNNNTELQNTSSSLYDVWGAVQELKDSTEKIDWLMSEKVNGQVTDVIWFVPSASEWAAFANMVESKVDSNICSNYGNYGLLSYYWSSSHDSKTVGYGISFRSLNIFKDSIYDSNSIRLARTY